MKYNIKQATAIVRGRGISSLKYESLPQHRDSDASVAGQDPENIVRNLEEHFRSYRRRSRFRLAVKMFAIFGALIFVYWAVVGFSFPLTPSCDTVHDGFICHPHISHFWGQYSPYFSVPSDVIPYLPQREQCHITFAQVLSRHGARDPTSSKTAKYSALIDNIHVNATSYSSEYSFIKKYDYTLGADQLSGFGQQQMINSGANFFERYKELTRTITPFIRSSGQDRVVESARNWTQGFHTARIEAGITTDDDYPYNIVIISEDTGSNNTLDHGLCTDFESGNYSSVGDDAQAIWASIFTPPITARINQNLPGINLTSTETIYLMDLCPFNTVADDYGTLSLFCVLFTASEWKDYDYYQALGKYYGFSWGNPLGATQGVGFANELIARLTASPVDDHTSTNSTLDSSQKTFPIGGKTSLYADFSHDNDMMAIFSALGLYNETAPLLKTARESVIETKGYSASWAVPFAARAYFEKMSCAGLEEELVRVIINDRVLPLKTCGGDQYGRCTLSSFVNSLSFAKAGGDWDKCFL